MSSGCASSELTELLERELKLLETLEGAAELEDAELDITELIGSEELAGTELLDGTRLLATLDELLRQMCGKEAQ